MLDFNNLRNLFGIFKYTYNPDQQKLCKVSFSALLAYQFYLAHIKLAYL